MADDLNQALQAGMAALKSGDKASARQHLTRAVELDENNEQAWLWLAGAVEDPAEMRICFENVLHLNPANPRAAQGLDWLRKQHPAVFADEAPPAPAVTGPTIALESPPAAPPPAAQGMPEPSAAMPTIPLGGSPPAAQPTPAYRVPTADGSQIAAATDLPPCPRCGKPTRVSDRRCRACGFSLMIKTDRAPQSRALVLIAGVMSILHTLLYIGAGLFLLVVVISGWTRMKNEVIKSIPPDQRAAQMRKIQPDLDRVFDQAIEPLINSGVITLAYGAIGMTFCIGMMKLRRWGYWGSWVINGLNWVSYLVFFAFVDRLINFMRPLTTSSTVPPGFKNALTLLQGAALFPAIYFTIVIICMAFSWRAFTDQSVRFIPPDENTGNAMEHFNRGVTYRKRGMWYQSMVEWEKAVELSPSDATYRHALGLVYAQLKRRDDALRELDEASQLAPDNMTIAQDLQKIASGA